jgi:hypothetical protein
MPTAPSLFRYFEIARKRVSAKRRSLIARSFSKSPKTGKETWIFFRHGPSSRVFPVVVPKDATDEQVEIACQAALAVSEEYRFWCSISFGSRTCRELNTEHLFVTACIHPSRKSPPVFLSFPIIPDVFTHPGAFEPLDVKLPGTMSGSFH